MGKHASGRSSRKHPLWKTIIIQALLLAGALLVISLFVDDNYVAKAHKEHL